VLQYMLLLAEVVMLVAITYMHWRTRKRLSHMHALSKETALERGSEVKTQLHTPPSAYEVEMVSSVADLLAELQAAASAVRDDWLRQEASLQEMLERTETATADLAALLEQAATVINSQPVSFEPMECDANDATLSEVYGDASPSLSLADAVVAFGEHLSTTGASQNAIKRTLGHVRDFTAWLGGQRYAELLLSRIDSTDVEAYLDYLKAQDYQPSTIKRKAAALGAFRNWADTLVSGAQPYDEATVHSKDSRLPVVRGEAVPPTWQLSAGMLAGTDRRRIVLDLAGQGLDQRTIAARTGLEQDTVRLVLATEQPFYHLNS
jgi:hypothetical protein